MELLKLQLVEDILDLGVVETKNKVDKDGVQDLLLQHHNNSIEMVLFY